MQPTLWLASYPKSGNTWLRAVYGACRSGAPPDINDLPGGPVASGRHHFDTLLGISASDLHGDEIDLLRPRADEVLAGIDLVPRLRKVHDGLFTGPAGEPIVSIAATRGALYVARDPRDVAVSLARQTGMTLASAVDWLNNPDATTCGTPDRLHPHMRQRLGTWSDHVVSWLDQSWFPVHLLRYEDCSRDPVAALGAAMRFAGLDPTDHEVTVAIERSSFPRLHSLERQHGFSERSGTESFFRRGEAGAWESDLTPTLARKVEEAHSEVMARLGYDPS